MGTAGFDGYLKETNPAWTRLLGWEGQELLERPLIDFVAPAMAETTLEIVRRLEEGETVNDFISHLRTKNGATRVLS